MGRLVPEKGLDVLLRALGAVRQRLPTVRLLVIGDGPSRPSLERLAERLKLTDAVVWAGFLENPFPQMARARMLVAPVGGATVPGAPFRSYFGGVWRLRSRQSRTATSISAAFASGA